MVCQVNSMVTEQAFRFGSIPSGESVGGGLEIH